MTFAPQPTSSWDCLTHISSTVGMATRNPPGRVPSNPPSEPSQAQPSSLKHLKGTKGQMPLLSSILAAQQGTS